MRDLATILIASAATVAGAASVGCSSPTSPGEVIAVALQAGELRSGNAPAGATSPPAVVGEAQRIVVLGLMLAPDPCHVISASGTKSDRQLTVTLTATRGPGGCILPIGEFAYRATIELSPGTYSVEVVHQYPGTGWKTEVARRATVLVY